MSSLTSRRRAGEHRALAAAALLALASAGSTGCGVAREPRLGEERCPDYGEQVAPVLSFQCRECHGGAAPAGGYSVETRLLALAPRDDGSPRLKPGDRVSIFLAAARGELQGHAAVPPKARALLEKWAVACRGAPRELAVHPPGWSTPVDAEQFHGEDLRAGAYALQPCRQCHGVDLSGGKAGVSCASCHPEGPLACNVCHGDGASFAPPRSISGARATTEIGVGAHRSHTSDCAACHVLPATPEQEGHYLAGGGGGVLDPSPAEVSPPATPGLTARWDRATATCSGVRCHAPSAADSRATNQTPRWTKVGTGETACGSCHGLPPASHGGAGTDCGICHRTAYSGGEPVPARHVNGVVDLGDGQGTGCGQCHGDATTPAPPRDVAGRAAESFPSVGAHRAHLESRHRISAQIACGECHLVPAANGSPGHVDSEAPAEVFPPGAGTLARLDGAAPVYNPATATCGQVYCHGAGARSNRDTASTRIPNPSWTGGSTQISCGSCHGAPPLDGIHVAGPITECVLCHGTTIDAFGNILITVDPVTGAISTTHINGQTTF